MMRSPNDFCVIITMKVYSCTTYSRKFAYGISLCYFIVATLFIAKSLTIRAHGDMGSDSINAIDCRWVTPQSWGCRDSCDMW